MNALKDLILYNQKDNIKYKIDIILIRQRKIHEETTSDAHDLVMRNKWSRLNSLFTLFKCLKVILKKIDEISIVKDLEINNSLKESETEKIDELELLEENLKFGTLKNRS